MTTVKIIIKDEVNCKIEGIEPADRRALMKMFEYEQPGARYQHSVRLGRWNGKISFFSMGGSTYINLLEDVITYLYDKHYTIELDDRRPPKENYVFSNITVDSFSDTVWPENHPLAGEPIILRDHQVNIVNSFLQNQQGIFEAATGSGKTIVTAALSKSVEVFGRSIVIVPNKSLVEQTEVDYKNLGLDVGVYFGDRKEYGKTHTICTWQSLSNIFKGTSSKTTETVTGDEFIKDVVCVIVDECHQCKASVLKSILTGELAHVPIRWGLTGTIPKTDMDKICLLISLGNIIGNLGASELQEKGILANCQVNIVQTKDTVVFDNYQSELKFLLEDTKRIDKITQLINSITQTGNTLILVDRVNVGKELQRRLSNIFSHIAGEYDVDFVSGSTNLKDRKNVYDDVSTATNKVIIATYGVAAVGINLVYIHNLVLIEPGKSFVRVIQSIGRGLRVGKDKDHVEIWDICSTAKFSKRHLTQRKSFYKEAQYPFVIEKIDY